MVSKGIPQKKIPNSLRSMQIAFERNWSCFIREREVQKNPQGQTTVVPIQRRML